MKISQVHVQNFRLLKNFKIDLQSDLSLVIGKNNCGKTSFLSLFEKFLIPNDPNKFSFDDFNIELQLDIKKHIQASIEEVPLGIVGIGLRLIISYDENDKLANLSPIMLDLDPDKRTVIIQFEYSLSTENKALLKKDFLEFQHEAEALLQTSLDEQKITGDDRDRILKENKAKKDVLYFLKEFHFNYFKLVVKAIEPGNENNFLDK
jgi:putative ATP-dependent endonuclease of the OLD family